MKISRRKRHGLVQDVDKYLLYMFNDFCCSADGHGKEVDSPLSLCIPDFSHVTRLNDGFRIRGQECQWLIG